MMDPRQAAEEFVRSVRDALGERVHSAALFGSVVRGEWVRDLSDINVLLMVDDIDAALIARLAPAAGKSLGRGVRPLLMEHEEWARAGDVFAIEIADMKDAHVALHGEDPVTLVAVQPSDLRLQAERELRAKLLHLHSGMLMTARSKVGLGELLMRALPSFATYLRTVLRLAEQPVPMKSHDVITAGCAVAGADAAPFLTVLDARMSGRKLQVSLSDPIVDEFNSVAERIATYTDDFGRQST